MIKSTFGETGSHMETFDTFTTTGSPGPSTVEPAMPRTPMNMIGCIDLIRVMERIQRRYLDRLRADLDRLGAQDISPAHVLLLFTIGDSDLSVRDLVERGHYLNSNASYSLKQLVQAGYVNRTASQRDRRSARIRLTDKARKLCRAIQAADEHRQRQFIQTDQDLRSLEDTMATLRKLDVAWATEIHNGEILDPV